MAIKNTFKITDLSAITKIDDNDLFIVADRDATEATSTKNMSILQLMNHIANNKTIANSITDSSSELGKAISNKISADITSGSTSQVIDKKIDTKVETAIAEITFDAGSAV